jgi:hypothetical protein
MFRCTSLILLGLAGIRGASAIVQPQAVQPVGLGKPSKANELQRTTNGRFRATRAGTGLHDVDDALPVLEAFQLCGCLYKGWGKFAKCFMMHCAVGFVVDTEIRRDPYDAIRFYIVDYMGDADGKAESTVTEAPQKLAFSQDQHRLLVRAYLNSSQTLRDHFCSRPTFHELCSDVGPTPLYEGEKKLIARRIMQASSLWNFAPLNPSKKDNWREFFWLDKFISEKQKESEKESELKSSSVDCEGLYCFSDASIEDAMLLDSQDDQRFNQERCKTEGVMSCREQCPLYPTDPFKEGEHMCRPQKFAGPWILNHRRKALDVFKQRVQGSSGWTVEMDEDEDKRSMTLGNVKAWADKYVEAKPHYSVTDDNCQKMVKYLLEAITGEVFPMHQKPILGLVRPLGKAAGAAWGSKKETLRDLGY